MAERTDAYLSTLTYLKYEEMMDMPVCMLEALLKVRTQKISKNPQAGNLTALLNMFGGTR